MKLIEGKYTTAKAFITNNAETNLEQHAEAQIKQLCDLPISEGSQIRVMPDVHSGAGCVIGLTMTVGDKIMPNLVGVDIGCGVMVVKFKPKKRRLDLVELDGAIKKRVPSGFSVRDKVHSFVEDIEFENLRCLKHINRERAELSIGTLGGGKHFIEVSKDDHDWYYLTVHSGRRHFGLEIANWYLKCGQDELKERGINDVPHELTYLTDEAKDDYIHDLKIAQKYAYLNRLAIISSISKEVGLDVEDVWESVHNYVDFEYDVPILRKGAISARNRERVIIPINMRDGVILGTGLGNPDWNYSAPHGAGRIMSRTQAKNSFTVSAFKKEMNGIFSTCVNESTLDESPFAYRNIDDIIEVIGETVKVDKIIKPIYNFKASEVQAWQKGRK